MSTITAAPTPTTTLLPLKLKHLYLLLTWQEVSLKYHWSLYLHTHTSLGYIIHVTRPTGFWFLDARRMPDTTYNAAVVVAVLLSRVDPDMEDALRARIAEVPLEDTDRWGELTCRTWLLRALEELDSEGWIVVRRGSTVEDVEMEAKDAAAAAAEGRGERVVVSGHMNL